MKITKVDMSIMLAGFIISLSAWLRYFFLPSDLGETLLGGLIGLIIMFLGWLHNLITNLANVQDQMEIYLSDLNKEDDDE